jgi:Na+/alanine symporter
MYRFVNQAVPALMLPLTGGVGLDVIAYWSIALLAAGAVALFWLLRRRTRQA